MTPKHLITHSRPRLIFALIVGGTLGLMFPASSISIVARLLLGWDVAVWTYLILMAWLIMHATQSKAKLIAEQEDSAQSILVLAILSVGAISSLAAIVIELASAKQVSGAVRFERYTFTMMTVLGSWLLIVIIYTLHYAHLFYTSPPHKRALKFPDDEQEPNYWDFLYFAFTITVAVQTSDVSIMSRTTRKAVTAQSVLSFFFNAAIIGFSINIAASVAGG